MWEVKEDSSQNVEKEINEVAIAKPTASKFEFVEANASSKETYCVYGEKGNGKTVLALGFPGKISALSFDRKTMAPKVNFYDNDSRIKIYDAVEYFNRDSALVLDSAMKTYEYVKFLLDNIAEKDKPDWILIDGLEILEKIAEFVMRKRSNLHPYQGIVNMNLWKIRRSILDEVHQRANFIAKRGVIYTVYTTVSEIIEEGTVISKTKVPKYIDTILWETDIVLFVENKFDSKAKKSIITLRCDTSKNDKRIKTGSFFDITDKKATEIINF